MGAPRGPQWALAATMGQRRLFNKCFVSFGKMFARRRPGNQRNHGLSRQTHI